MLSFFSSDPNKKLRKQRKELLRKAMETQRSGDLRAYASMMKEIEKIEQKLNGDTAK